MPYPRSLLLCFAGLLAACGGTPKEAAAPAAVSPQSHSSTPAATEAGRRVNAVADDYWAHWVQTFPLAAMFSGVPEAPNDRLGDNSLAALRTGSRPLP